LLNTHAPARRGGAHPQAAQRSRSRPEGGGGSGRWAAAAPSCPPKGQLLHTCTPKARLSFLFRLVDNRKAAQRACGGPASPCARTSLRAGRMPICALPPLRHQHTQPHHLSLSPPPTSAKRLVQRGKVLHGALGVGLHALVALLPVCFLVFDFRLEVEESVSTSCRPQAARRGGGTSAAGGIGAAEQAAIGGEGV